MKRTFLLVTAIALGASGSAIAATAKHAPATAAPNPRAAALAAKFSAWDANMDGVLTQKELVGVNMSAKNRKSEAKIFAAADRNRDGKISKAEFNTSIEARLNRVEA